MFINPAEVDGPYAESHQRVDIGTSEQFEAGRLPDATRIEFSWLVRKVGDAGGMMPIALELAEHLARAGLRDDRPLVAYDRDGGGRSGRLLWCLHVMGHTNVRILDGGLDAWQADGMPVASGPAEDTATTGSFSVGADATRMVDKASVLASLDDGSLQLLDTRSAAEFTGTDCRAARAGHIPGALHWDWVNALDAGCERRLRPVAELREELEVLGLVRGRRIAAYCQTHHRSSHTYAVLRHLGFDAACGYAGAWSEWGNSPEVPIE
jgi:thiosulfate/3-mercaptopyruvate sulfurtransferase